MGRSRTCVSLGFSQHRPQCRLSDAYSLFPVIKRRCEPNGEQKCVLIQLSLSLSPPPPPPPPPLSQSRARALSLCRSLALSLARALARSLPAFSLPLLGCQDSKDADCMHYHSGKKSENSKIPLANLTPRSPCTSGAHTCRTPVPPLFLHFQLVKVGLLAPHARPVPGKTVPCVHTHTHAHTRKSTHAHSCVSWSRTRERMLHWTGVVAKFQGPLRLHGARDNSPSRHAAVRAR